MDPMMTEEDRDAVTVFFRAQPLTFDSTGHTVHVDAWLQDMEQTFLMCHIPDYLQVMLAAKCIFGDARLWWTDVGERRVPTRTWTQFRSVMLQRYGPLPYRGVGVPVRDPAIYQNMRHTRYQILSQAWHAYPGESMIHYWWRFQEMMHPYVPQDLPEPELEAQILLRNGVPQHIRQHVPDPSREKTVGLLMDEILAAEEMAQNVGVNAQAQEGQASNADNLVESEPQYEVGPLEEEDPQYEVGPLEDDEVELVHPPEDVQIPLIIISSDDEAMEDLPVEVPDDEEDPEEILDEEEE